MKSRDIIMKAISNEAKKYKTANLWIISNQFQSFNDWGP